MSLINRDRIWRVGVDAVLVAAAWWLAFEFRFDQGIPPVYERYRRDVLVLVVAINLAVLLATGVYNKWWRYTSLRDMQAMLRSIAIAAGLVWISLWVLAETGVLERRLPLGVAVTDVLLTLLFVGGVRVIVRSAVERPRPGRFVPRGKEVLVVGAGDAGGLVVREMLSTRMGGYAPIGLIDDDPRKRNMRLHGVRVFGATADLPRVLRERRPDEVHIAIPSAAGATRSAIVSACREAGVPVKTLPSVNDLLNGDADLVRQIREVRVEDLLGREPVHLEPQAIGAYAAGKVVLVTGAGGSIGSELCRQLVRIGPARLVLLDHAENNLFLIERELVERGVTNIAAVIGDVKDRAKLDRVLRDYRPAVVFHAAAYKHVPLMEANPLEALRNNALGTRTMARAAASAGVERFVLVSTDKAVNARTVMGSSKALCEWIVEAMAVEHPGTVFVAVRFGNVLGSSGSVVPIFTRQIAHGGPVTVTHSDMTRFFMTIPEAAQLIVQAGGVGQGGEIFVLDMGEPVRILDVARDMIRLSGREPDRDVKIEIVGVRPGEKLHEELFEPTEEVRPTHHPKLLRATRPPIDASWLARELESLEAMVDDGDTLGAVARLAQMMRQPRRGDPALGRDEAARTHHSGRGAR